MTPQSPGTLRPRFLDTNEMKRKTIPVIIGLLLLTAAFIFFMSSRDVDQSLNDSIGFDRLLAHWFVEGFDQMSPEDQLAAALRFDEPIRHVAHTLEVRFVGVFAHGALFGAGPQRLDRAGPYRAQSRPRSYLTWRARWL